MNYADQINYNPLRRQGIHLVPATRRSRSKIRLTLGNFIADIIASKKKDGRSCHYVVQRIGSPEIIELAKFDDFASAEAEARNALDRWHSRDQNHSRVA
jgi:hypothetical protein